MGNIKTPGGVVPQGVVQQQGLNQKEQQQLRDKDKGKISAQDAQRLAQQVGFDRKQKKKGAISLGDSGAAPIPLPEDDITEQFNQGAMDQAQETLTLAGARFEDATKELEGGGAENLGMQLLQGTFTPTAENMAKLEAIDGDEDSNAPDVAEAAAHLEGLFGSALGEDTPMAHKMMALSLAVAGHADKLSVNGKQLDEKTLLAATQEVSKAGNKAVGEAQKRSKGISKQLGTLSTYIAKR